MWLIKALVDVAPFYYETANKDRKSLGLHALQMKRDIRKKGKSNLIISNFSSRKSMIEADISTFKFIFD